MLGLGVDSCLSLDDPTILAGGAIMPELTWEGKYDKDGRKAAPLRVALPFQAVETVNESAMDRQRTLDLFTSGASTEWRNRLIWGDKKYVLPALASELSGKVDLIYIDPPFATGQDFSIPVTVGEAGFMKEPSMIEQKAYRDTWSVTAEARARGATYVDTYLRWFYDTVVLLRELLSPTGSMYVHLDWHVGAQAKLVLDEVFGTESFQNEIVWQRTSAHSDTHRYGLNYDVIFFYSKTDRFTWNPGFHNYSDKQIAKYRADVNGEAFADMDLTAAGTRHGATGLAWRGHDPNTLGRHWAYEPQTLDELDEQGRIYWPKSSGFPRLKRYLRDMKGVPLQSVWTDIYPVNSQAVERLGYETQKPESLLERIVNTSSNKGDLVLDCFCGSGTTGAVAERLGRRWIMGDLGRFAIHTSRKRLLALPDVTPFVVQNLGKYERQVWQSFEFGEHAEERTRSYRRFILELYRAKPIEGYVWLHGLKEGRMVHVGTVDAPVTVGDIKQIATEFGKAIGTGHDSPTMKAVDVLGWDFAFEMNEVARQTAGRAGIDVRFWRIPREVLDKRAIEQGDIRFFELAALSVDLSRKARTVSISLRNFVIPTDDVPEEVQRAITDWTQWIDYWAVDWDNRGDTFHNQWQAYRTRKEPTLKKSISYAYEAAGRYRVVVKVIDILGNDTTKTLTVEVS